MTTPLRILLLEDSIQDAELIQELLEADHFVCEVTRVQTRAEFLAALEDGGFDLVLSDYKLPSFDGLSALKLTLNAHPDLPFIFVSGFGEEIAIEALTSGAKDYVLKTRLSRLVPSVQRALREARERAERKKPEEALLRILLLEDSIQDAELIQELLEADHFVCEVTPVQTRGEFVAALEHNGIDLILADYKLPSFDGLSALKLALSARPDLPLIFVSGFGEEIAIEALTSGATDYVLKTRLSRLVPSGQRALREARERAERKKPEEALLRILLLEDSIQDAELIQELLEADHFVCEVSRVQTRAEFVAALEHNGIDLILADYKLPSFDGLSALKLALSARPDLPFIFVSGFGEEIAIEALTSGATDYVLKTRLSRLVPSVQRALREARERAERKKAEEALRRSEMYLAAAEQLSHTGSFGWNASTGEIYWSDETYRIFECEPTTKPTVQIVIDRSHPDDRMHLGQIIDRASIDRSDFSAEHRLMMADGSVKYLRVVAHRASGEDPESVLFIGAVTDITESKRDEETLREQANLLNLTNHPL